MSYIYGPGDAVLFTDWWPDPSHCVKLYKLNWGERFTLVNDQSGTVYTLKRGDGAFMIVTWGEDMIGNVHIGEKVVRHV